MSSLLRALQPYRARLDRDLTSALHQQERSAVGGHLLIGALTALLLRSQLSTPAVLGWLGSIVAASLFRGWNAWRFSRLDPQAVGMRDQWLHTGAIIACGLAWSIGFVLVMPQLEVLQRAIVLLILSGLSSAAIVTLSPRVSSFAFFASALMVPAILSLAVGGNATERMLAGLGLVALGFGFASCTKARTLTLGHYLQRYRNEQMVRDLATAKKGMEEALQRSETANRAKSAFLANMSHEVRTPMNGVLGMAELLGQSELREDQQEMLAILQSSGRDLLAILDDVLDLSKLEGDGYEIVREPFALGGMLDELAALYAVAAEEKGLQFVYDVPVNLPESVQGDENRLRQLLQGLLDNAIKFTDRGAVSFSAQLQLGGPEGATLEAVVEDQGRGIPSDQLEAVFDSFTQVDGSPTREHGGAGLGLTISRRLVELMGGTIAVGSELERGSRFQVRLPLAAATGPQALARPARVLLLAQPTASIAKLAARLGACGLDLVHHTELSSCQEQEAGSFDWLLADRRTAPGDSLQQAARRFGASPVRLSDALGSEHEPNLPVLHSPFRADALRRLFLPESETEQPATGEEAAPAETPSEALTVLVAEDNPTNARIAQRMLAQLGMQVRIARNGREAVEEFRRNRPHLIFMDVQMPELDGMAATAEIRALPGGDQVPIIALTAHAMKGYREKCLEAGMNDYFTKPLRRADLSEALRRWHPRATQRRRA